MYGSVSEPLFEDMEGGQAKTGAVEPIIRCERLTLGYGRAAVLRDVNLDIPCGVFLPFVGPNGAGKTTLLRAILGLIKPMAGTIHTPFASSPPGYVSQQKSIDPLYPVSALDIVLMGFYTRMGPNGRDAGRFRDKARELLARFELDGHENKTFDELSGGMRQKVLIARALAADPAVLIMDEPTTELDHHSQRMVMEILHDASARECRTALLVHHGLDALVERASRVCLVRDGAARVVPIENARF